jgi:regulatory protein
VVILTELKQTGPETFLARFDNGEELKTTLNVVTDQVLFAGKHLEDEEMEALRGASSRSRCKQRALRIMGARAMSVKELTDRLKEKGERPEDAEEAAQWLLEMHLLDDQQYAEMCVRHYAAKGYGPGRIRSELYRRGISKELWEDALDSLPEQDDQIDRLLRRKLRGEHPDKNELRKASDFLYRRGFQWEEIRAAIQRYQ